MRDQLAEVIRGFRRRAELTQEALAERSGVSVRTIRGMETGKRRNHHWTSLRQLSDALGLSADEHRKLLTAALDTDHRTASVQVPLPRQLPAAPQWFTGRARELSDLAELLDVTERSGICVITGTGGIGKTSLALRWAHQHVDRFPDGQLFVNLHGFDPSARPTAPGLAVRGFLYALGIEPGSVPAGVDAQITLYRSLVAGKRMVIVADNAADTAQVLPLVPGGPSCAMLVTSRVRLPGLVAAHGAHPVAMDVLSESEAYALLADRLGGRLALEPGAVSDLIDSCAGLPLALNVIAGRAQSHPGLSLATLAVELRDTGLSALDEDPTSSLSVALSCSYRALSDDQVRALGLLSVADGQDFGLRTAAGLIGLPIALARKVLHGLVCASLLHQDATGQYRMHPLIRHYAAARAQLQHG